MLKLLSTECLKLRRSYMVLISAAGAAFTPFMTFLLYSKSGGAKADFSDYALYTNWFTTLLTGVLLYGLITTYVFNREHEDDTLKHLLTLPVSRLVILTSKLLIVFLWVLVMTFISFLFVVIFSKLGSFQNITMHLILQSFCNYLISSGLLFLLMFPIMLIVLLKKGYVPALAFSIMMVVASFIILSSSYAVFFPWSAITIYINPKMFPINYPIWYYLISTFITSTLSFIVSLLYFFKKDIQ